MLSSFRKFDKLTREQARQVFSRTLDDIERYETAFNSLSRGILVCDERQKLVLTNKSAQRLLLIKHHDEYTEPVWDIIKDSTISEFLHDTLSSGNSGDEQCFVFEGSNSPRRLLNFHVLPLVKEHHITGSLIIIEDVTEKKIREAELRRIESLASLTTLAAGVAHEIKNPLASLSIHVQLLQKMLSYSRETCKKEDTDTVMPFESMGNHLSILNEEIGRLNHIVVDFLFAVRPMNLMLIKSNINKLLKEIIAFIKYEAEDARITCVAELQKNLPWIEFDERYMKQALLNLIKNSLDAMQNKTDKVLTIKSESDDTQITISIGDTGSGISGENKAKIFEPYFTTKKMGTGLGLTLVYKIIKEHKGEIRVDSKEGVGTTFSVMLPLPQPKLRLLNYAGDSYEI
ncbi:MAG: GHKL domain-containing protein [Spirochaetaceae bacterium]|nr:GHKL domain-containing protein [Spirochaetaceae bacterium]